MPEQRIVPTRQLTEVADCLEAMATGKGGWAWADVLDELRAIIDGPGVETVAEWVKADYGNYPTLRWRANYVASIGDKFYLAAPSAPAQAVPDGWQLVPKEPTREMLNAYVEQNGRFQSGRSDWHAMLASAPQPPVDVCTWSPYGDEIDDSGTFLGSCGAIWTFTEGGVAENDLRFCPQCGRKVATAQPSAGAYPEEDYWADQRLAACPTDKEK